MFGTKYARRSTSRSTARSSPGTSASRCRRISFRTASTSKIAQILGRIEDSGSGIVMLDEELGKREFHG
jgi:hypothetical protein